MPAPRVRAAPPPVRPVLQRDDSRLGKRRREYDMSEVIMHGAHTPKYVERVVVSKQTRQSCCMLCVE